MEKHDIDIIDIAVKTLGQAIIQLRIDNSYRYFTGMVELPSTQNSAVSINITGTEITSLFIGKVTLSKTKEQVLIDIQKLIEEQDIKTIKIPVNSNWIVYS